MRLLVDPVSCDGIGMCAHLAPELLVLDRWGYPIAPVQAVQATDVRAARAAVVACPRRALFLDDHR